MYFCTAVKDGVVWHAWDIFLICVGASIRGGVTHDPCLRFSLSMRGVPLCGSGSRWASKASLLSLTENCTSESSWTIGVLSDPILCYFVTIYIARGSVWTLEDNREVAINLQKDNKMEWWNCVVEGVLENARV